MANSSPHLLVAVPRFPWPAREGLTLRVSELLNQLGGRWEITLITPKSSVEPPIGLRELISLDVDDDMFPNSVRQICREVVGKVQSRKPDAVLLFRLPQIVEFPEFRKFPPTLFDLVDAFSLASWKDLTVKGLSLRGRIGALRNLIWGIRFENALARCVKTVTVVGEADSLFVRRLTLKQNIQVISNGVHISRARTKEDLGKIPAIVFSGVMEYKPNVDAAMYFADNVFPLIKRNVPECEFHIVGRKPGKSILDLEKRGSIKVLADVPDMAAALRKSWVAVAPMMTGAGVKNKVLEAWGVGIPVVMSSFAGNGLCVEDQNRSLIVDGAEATAEAVTALLKDNSAAFSLGEKARQYIANHQSWKQIGEQFHQCIKAVL